ncbi:hypothetical protein WJ04_09225 [Burkholderia vietnamiensis]|uniref:acyltransferase family protein n=1 Tax=Burkholderia vietnamiensis TaxID=60552 RepID=UPI00075A1B2C|nr:acyltransferase [Burkholderia vietnamiensis]KVF09000.1 hypothetical protein WJ04_09225 [Burkholderia vietnamiensis]
MRLKHLDGLRGVLALTVAASHAIGANSYWAADRPLAGAGMAVLFFFILSGFVLCVYLERTGESKASFVVTRFLRLWPLHAVCALLTCATILWLRSRAFYAPSIDLDSLPVLASNFGFLHHLGLPDPEIINDPSWSIGVEFWVSAFILPWLFRAYDSTLVAVIAVCFALLLTTGHVLNPGWILPHVSGALLMAISGMAIGALAYRYRAVDIGVPRWTLYVCVATCALSVYLPPTTISELAGVIGFVPLLTACFQKNGGDLYTAFESRPLRWLGRISFSLYLAHMPVQLLMNPFLEAHRGTWAYWVGLTAASLAAGWFVNTTIEQPLHRAFAKRKRAPEAPAIPDGA